MFPNPHDAIPLPPRPSLERYRNLAKGLAAACKSGAADAIGDWAGQWVREIAKLVGPTRQHELDHWIDTVEAFARRRMLGGPSAARKCALADAQFVIARSHGFAAWPRFAGHLEALATSGSPVSRFEAAADAIVGGAAPVLRLLLRQEPELVRARSTREHGATLLHYVAANGVEGYRQKTPRNIVAIARILLRAGAEVDAAANVYGGGCTALGLAATSVHPERAGVQEALLQTLLDHGARLEPPPAAGNRQSLVAACVANGRQRAAAFLAARGAPLDLAAAAALGRLDAVAAFLGEDGAKTDAAKEQLDDAFLFACGNGHNAVIELLLAHGADLAAHRGGGQTALHWAAIGGHPETVELLLRHRPPLEVRNAYGGTVLEQALWSAAHGGDPDVYLPILQALAAAGAKLPERHVPVNPRVDRWLAQQGSRAEPAWHWSGEEPRRGAH